MYRDYGATCTVTLKHVSHDAPARNLRQRVGALPRTRVGAPPAEGVPPRGKYWWLRWAVLAIVAIVLAIEVALGWDQLAKAWVSLYRAKWWWLLAAVAAAGASMHSFAQIQRTLLKSAGVHVKQWRSEAAFYAANSLSTTLPGGPVLSATFLLRQQRIWGASTVVASWQLVMSGVLQAVGLALLGLGGAFFLGAKNNPFSLLFTLGGFVTLLLLAQAVASRPELIEGIGRRVLSWANSVRGRPADAGLPKWRETLMQLESVSLGRRDLGVAFGWSLFNWIADVACLGFAAYAAGDHASVGGLAVAYAAARGRHHTADARWSVGGRGGAGTRPGIQRHALAECHLGDVDLPADQLAAHRRNRLGGVLLHVPHREHCRFRQRSRPANRSKPATCHPTAGHTLRRPGRNHTARSSADP